MSVVVVCPECTRKARVPDPMLGQSVRCPTCGITFVAAVDGPTAAAPPPAAPAVTEPDDEPAVPKPDPAQSVQRPPLPADPDVLRSLRAGLGLQLLAQCLYAGGLTIILLVALAGLLDSPAVATPPPGPGIPAPRGGMPSSDLRGFAVLAGALLIGCAGVVGLTGSTLCMLAPMAHLARGLALAALVLDQVGMMEAVNVFRMVGIFYGPNNPFRGPGAVGLLVNFLMPFVFSWLFETGRLTVLALFWRAVCIIVRDGTGAALALRLAYTVPAVQGVLFFLGLLLGFTGGPSAAGSAGPAVTVIGLAVQLGLLVWGVIVADRVWRRLRSAVPPAV